MFRSVHYRLLPFAASVALASSADLSAQATAHPQPRYLYRPIPVTTEINRDANPTAQLMVTRLTGDPLATFGAFDAPDEVVFAEIVDVAVDDDDRVYVLDGQYREIRVFSKDGDFIEVAGGAGQGPGEFRPGPRAIAIGADGVVRVLGVGGVHEFVWQADTLAYVRTLRREIEAVDMCRLGDALYLHGVRMEPGGLINLVQDGEITASFGDVYRAPIEAGSVAFSSRISRLECVMESETLMIAPRGVIGEVHGYAPDGQPKWIAVIDGFRPMNIVQNNRGGVTVTTPEDGFDRLYTLTRLRGTTVLVQLAYTSQRDRIAEHEYTRLLSYLLNADTGELVAVGSRVPRVIASNDRIFVAIRNDPYPQVSVYKW